MAETPEEKVNMGSANDGRNIILVGMMGTGKSTVGQLLAQELGFEFIDLDNAIVKREGRSIPEIFAENGESYFRVVETAELQISLLGGGKVISTGGGAVLAPGNTSVMLENGCVIALTAAAEDIISRVAEDKNRPLLAGNAEERVRRLMEERRNAYLFAHYTVDTTGLRPAQVSEYILMQYRG
ncbi:shikimate kinase [Paenibacillus sp. sgz500958]|uniref:shikimate kinase n=1 Tax=Paenibacillus sp. sgz500958 TaxID=3242475 RepID=UPI0036D26025